MFYVALGIILAVAITELVLSLKWLPSYFTTGIPIFVSKIETSQPLTKLQLDELATKTRTAAGAPFSIRSLAPEVIAFRESSVQYVPLMRGIIRRKTNEPAVVVQGLLNWTMLTLAAVFMFGLRGALKEVLLYIGGAFAILYFIQSIRFWTLAKHVRTQLTASA